MLKKRAKTSPKSFNSIGILGYGEVGQAVARFYGSTGSPQGGSTGSPQVKIKDLKRDDGLTGVKILNVCLPWSDRFTKIVSQEIKKIRPKLTIIHSTVAPGTIKKISRLTRSLVVHSPVRGLHPHLFKGIRTFVKYVGADNKKAGKMAKSHLEKLGIKTKVFYPSLVTEFGKLLDTTYYSLCIAWHGEMKKLCDRYKIDFEETVSDFNRTYNQGYKKLGKLNVIRPVLFPPQNGIGGHCMIPNVKILKKYFKSQALDLILEYQSNQNTKRKNHRLTN